MGFKTVPSNSSTSISKSLDVPFHVNMTDIKKPFSEQIVVGEGAASAPAPVSAEAVVGSVATMMPANAPSISRIRITKKNIPNNLFGKQSHF